MKLLKALVLLSIFAVSNAHAAPILLGSATLNSTDDLTQIQLDSGDVIEWLDLTETQNMDISMALSSFSGSGFQLATLSDIQVLLDVFGLPTITSVFPLSGSETFASTAAIVDNFTSFLGITANGENATGWLDDQLDNSIAGVLNVRGTENDVFVNNFDDGAGDNGGANPSIGVWLFRPAVVEVSEPSAIVLLGFGLLLLRRRIKS